MEFVHIFSELVVGYVALFILAKILGKTQITQITTFDFISAVVLGELVGNALFDEEIGIKKILFAVMIWGTLIYTTEIITQKFKRVRKTLEGEPSIVIRKGKIDYKQLKINKLDINQLQHLLRSKDIFSIRECEFAILETDGTISVLRKPSFENPTNQDLNLPLKPVHLPISLVLDGELVRDNLQLVQWDEHKLLQEMKPYGISKLNEVLYAEWKEGEALHVQTY
ncbi:DUF421 domain-containing protein [Neobacillus sp. D3-1R]|uniref:DUF421 domain-containing protein n=1 Tax=Neobacillus sp. D3-1R TaxID=3445778 RepID=UPI003F9F3FEF